MGQEETNLKDALYVEDDEDYRDTVAIFLKRAGYDVTLAGNLQEAEGHAQRQRFDVYVSDGSYPRAPGEKAVQNVGLEFHEKVRQMHEDPFTFVFVSGEDSLEKKCVEQGIKFFNKDGLQMDSLMAYLQDPQQ